MSAAAATPGVEGHADRLRALSRSILAETELAFAEHRSAAKVAELVEADGFEGQGLEQPVAVGLLRQHLQGGPMRYGILVTGVATPNIVPASTSAMYHLRAPYVESLQTAGDPGKGPVSGRSMGNVTLVLPAINPTIAIDWGDAVNQQPDLATEGAMPSVDRATCDGVLAWVAAAGGAV
ncbi:MAG: hypothetical protein ACRDTH_18610 [Pseudonocardiaceae bacterium]